MKFVLKPGKLKLADLRVLLDEKTILELDPHCHKAIHAAEKVVTHIIAENKTVYGINTGFGALATKRINVNDLEQLQKKIILSHAAGTGELLSDQIVRLILLLKINSLARGFSGVRLKTIEILLQLFNQRIYPCIPSQGSVGASGDLAPLAHLSIILLGIGQARYEGKIISAEEALTKINLTPLQLAPKEGLALINGTQVSTALALHSLLSAEDIFIAAIVTGALSTDAALGSYNPFEECVHQISSHTSQHTVAKMLRTLLQESAIHESHRTCQKVQDPYSLRCQPQVMGACLNHLRHASETFLNEANTVSDNPLIFSETNKILTGGNFHAEAVAMAADTLALVLAEIGSLSERRIGLLMDPHFNSLPPFLVKNAGINSGFMMAHVTASALASENKSLAHPASVDSIPTSANQEDHVSMATYAARRLLLMAENTTGIIAIELLSACQGIDLRRPLTTSALLEKIHRHVRERIAFYDQDRYFAPDIVAAKQIVRSDILRKLTGFTLFPA